MDSKDTRLKTPASSTQISTYRGDDLNLSLKGYQPKAQTVPYGTSVEGVYFDGYPQLEKAPLSAPEFGIKQEKDIMVALRDGVRIAVDVYRPDTEGQQFPVILAWGLWGKDAQEAVAWNADKPQPYYHSPFWDGTMEAGNYTYLVPRGFVHVIPDPRGIGNSEGDTQSSGGLHDPKDIHDLIRWIAKQPWCNGKVGMMGPSSYSWAQSNAASSDDVPDELVAIHPDELPFVYSDYFHGMYDTMMHHIEFGRHGNDSTLTYANRPIPPAVPQMMQHVPKPVLDQWVKEALDHPDIKFNTKWYSALKYPYKSPETFDMLMFSFHPQPMENRAHKIKKPMYIGTPWGVRFYIFGSFEVFEKASTPQEQKKLIVYPPGYPSRPYTDYHDETVRWYDHWLKGIDNGILDEPPLKLFVMGENKWRFENEWPLARTEWTKFYLHPQGKLSAEPVQGSPSPDKFTQPAAYQDSTVYCLRYSTEPMTEDMEVTGPVAIYLDAALDIDDTNWMVDLVDVAPDGTRQQLSCGYLKAKFRAVDEAKSRPYQPIHPRQESVPVVPGEVNTYAIEMMPTSNVFKKGHAMEIIIRNQDDILSRLGTWGVYMLPFMQTVTHTIHLGKSHILLPLIPAQKNRELPC